MTIETSRPNRRPKLYLPLALMPRPVAAAPAAATGPFADLRRWLRALLSDWR